MIGKLKKIFETQTTILQKKAGVFKDEEIECAVDETPIDCADLQENYTGIPAPAYLENDHWFGSAPKTEKAMEYVQKKNEELYRKLAEPKLKESENIHQEMYELATKSGKTTTQLNPVGGSETFQEGPGGWTSGTGYQGQGLTDR